MTTVNLSPFAGAGAQFFDNNGVPLAGGFLYTYSAGTTTPLATYTTNAGTVANSNPIVLDSSGRVPNEIWLITANTYKFVLQNANATQIGSWDNIPGINDTTALTTFESNLASSTGSSLVGYNQGGTNAVTSTVQVKLQESVSVKDFGAKGDGTTDDTTAIKNALAYIVGTGVPGEVIFPAGTYKCTSGITIDTAYITVIGYAATLNFSTMTSGVAITFYGDTLTPVSGGTGFGNANKYFSGLQIIGNSYSGSVIGMSFNGNAANTAACHYQVRNCVVINFGTGIQISYNAYILSFDAVEVNNCGSCLILPSAASTNAGERITFTNSAFYNSVNGISLQNANADVYLFGCTIDGMSGIYFYVTCGVLNIYGCHIEGNIGSSRVVWNDNSSSGSTAYISIYGGSFVLKTSRTVAIFQFDGPSEFLLAGSLVNDSTSSSTTIMQGAGSGMATITGTTLLSNGGASLSSLSGMYTNFSYLGLGNNGNISFGQTINSSILNVSKTLGLGTYTVATLPTAGTAGRTAYVTDATTPTFLGALTGGGSVKCPVFDNGSAWVAG